MNASPQVAPIRHVTMLTMDPFSGVAALTPFFVGIFKQFVIEGKIRRFELVTGFTEGGILIGGASGVTAVGQLDILG